MAEIDIFISPEAQKQVNDYKKEISEIAGIYGNLVTSSSNYAKQLKAQTDAETAGIKQKQELEKLEQQKLRTDSQVLKNEVQLQKAIEAEQKAIEKKNKQLKDSQSAYNNLNKQLNDSRQKAKDLAITYGENSKQFKAAQKEVINLDARLKRLDASVGQNQRNVGNYKSAWEGLSGAFFKITGIIAAAGSAIKLTGSIIQSTQSSGDAFNIAVAGWTAGWDAFKKSIATLDFKNLIERMKLANEVGREYAKILDDLGDRRRTLTLVESESKIETEKLKQTVDNVNLSYGTRIEAAKSILTIETQLLEKRKSIAQQEYDAESKRLAALTGLTQEQILSFIRNYDEEKNIRETAILFIEKEDELRRKLSNARRSTNQTEFALNAEIAKQAKIELENLLLTTDKNVKQYALIFRGYGKTTDEELNKVTEAYKGFLDAQSSFYTGTRRSQNAYNSLLKQLSGTDEELINKETDLIEVQQILLKQAQEMPGKTEEEIIARNKKIQVIQNEIDRLKKLGEIQKLNSINLEDENKQLQKDADEIDKDEDERLQNYLESEDQKLEKDKESKNKGIEQEEKFNENLIIIAGENARAQKALSFKNAVIKGYEAVQGAFADTPGPLPVRIAASVIAGIISAANVSNILSADTSIKAFAKGTDSTPSGLWLAGEKGRELKIDRYGNAELINKPTLFSNEVGSKIFTNAETETILRQDKLSKRQSFDDSRLIDAIKGSQQVVNLDKRGILTISRNGQGLTKYLNERYRN
ncbi:MAG: hypothetical protein BV457_04755 [Thermoplasmata archaeon M9B1D]|nr:MAG: hypothetical protein BV457_04755 [Thermoplasmata archaeon M9B1D]